MVSGLGEMLSKFNNVKTAGVPGLVTAALFIKAESQKICPVDTDALRSGAYTDVVQEVPSMITAEIGYKEAYAPMVHEAPDSRKWQAPQAENKFLEKAIVRNEKKILRILGAEIGEFLR